MERFIARERDRECWNAFVAASPFGHVLQSWEWGEIKAAGGWDIVRLGLRDGESIRAAAQVQIRALPYGVGTIAYVPKGPVLDYGDPRVLPKMLGVLRDFATRHSLLSLKIEPEVREPSPVPTELLAAGLEPARPVQMRSSIWVDLTPPEDEILARQKQKTRYNIRLAAKKGVKVTSAQPTEIDQWYRLYTLTAQRDGFTIHEPAYYRTVLDVLQPCGMADLLLATHDDDLLAGIVVFSFGHSAQYMYGASSNEKRNLMAPYLLQWEGMRWARARGAAVYDLWGIPDRLEESEELWGVYRHKRGYGGEIVRYIGAYDMVLAPLRHAAIERVGRALLKRVGRLRVQAGR